MSPRPTGVSHCGITRTRSPAAMRSPIAVRGTSTPCGPTRNTTPNTSPPITNPATRASSANPDDHDNPASGTLRIARRRTRDNSEPPSGPNTIEIPPASTPCFPRRPPSSTAAAAHTPHTPAANQTSGPQTTAPSTSSTTSNNPPSGRGQRANCASQSNRGARFSRLRRRCRSSLASIDYQIEMRLGGQYDIKATPIISSRVIEPQLRESSEFARLSPIMKYRFAGISVGPKSSCGLETNG